MVRHVSVLLLPILLVAGCSGGKKAAEKADQHADKALEQPAIAVHVTPAATGSIQETLALSGDIRSAQETPVAAKVGGRLAELSVDEGTRVKAGQVIARIDATDYELQVMQSRASLASAEANRASALTNLATAEDNHGRLASLHGEGGVSEQQYVSAKNQVAASQTAVRAAEAQIAQAKAAIAMAQQQVANAVVRAPFDGVVTKKSAEVGGMLQPMSPVVTVATVRSLEVKVPVGQSSLAGVRVGAQATFTVPTYADRQFVARVAEVAPTLDQASRSAQVTLRIVNTDGALSPGMFARVSLPTARHDQAVLLPAAAVVTEDEKPFVFLVQGEQAVKQPVKLGLSVNGSVELLAGVQAGDKVVTLGQGQLEPGDKVTVVAKGE